MSRSAIKHPIHPALQKQGGVSVGCFFACHQHPDALGRLDAVNLGPDGLVDLGDYLWDKPRSIRYGLNTPAASETQTLDGLLRRQKTQYSAAQSGSDFSLTYGYNNENHITGITGNPQGDLAYGYDEADRLTSAARTSQTDNKTEQFSYDNAYNRLAANDSQYSYSTTRNGLLDSITTQNITTTFTHDANGHRTQKTGPQQGTENWVYEYNAQERLTRITKNNIEQATYKYNAQGQRVQKTANGTTTFYLYNSLGLAAEYDQTGTLQKEYGYLPGQPYMTNPVFLRTSTSFAYYQNDHLGTPQRLVDKQGITVWQASYDAFGKATTSINTVENNLRFAGQYFDSESSLHQNWFRDYDPKTGRYIERDPVGLKGGMNTYAYVMGNPVYFIDLTGLARCTYSQSSHELKCTSNDGSKRASTIPDSTFSGNGDCKNNPKCNDVQSRGPIPKGYYDVKKSPNGWWDLRGEGDSKCRISRVLKGLGLSDKQAGRCGFYIHQGAVSDGCITLDAKDPDSGWSGINDILNSDNGTPGGSSLTVTE